MTQNLEHFNYKAEFVSYLIKRAAQEDYQRIAVAKFNEERQKIPLSKSKIPKIIHHELEAKEQEVGSKPLKFCIIGAGVAGLYTALILKSLGIDYEILEASDRVGGRIYTHHFTKADHDYYDIGAMRFPDNPMMKRTFDLFKRMDLGETGDRKKEGQLLIPYYLKGRNCPTRYNDITALMHDDEECDSCEQSSIRESPNVENDPFKVSTANGGPVPMRGYDAETVHWLETTDSASGWFNEAFAENVIESLEFGYADESKGEKPISWYCIEGGTGKLIERMVDRVSKEKIKMKHWVTRIALCNGDKGNTNFPMEVEFDNKGEKDDTAGKQIGSYKTETRHYSAVINTTTLGALQKMDLTGMALPYGMKTAIRVLRYDSSTKVAIKFKEIWWRDADFMDNYPISCGGVAKTDMSLRVCVYPSYNIHDPIDKGGVLLASYTWGQDSERIASHISTEHPDEGDDLIRLMLYNLARLHTVTSPEATYETRCKAKLKRITELYDRHHAYDWSKDPHAAGAFALFSPGQFSTLIPYLMRPAADSRFVVVGEATSANHAWIVGALDSAVRGLGQILIGLGLYKEYEKMVKEFGGSAELKKEQLRDQIELGKLDQDALDRLKVGVPVGS